MSLDVQNPSDDEAKAAAAFLRRLAEVNGNPFNPASPDFRMPPEGDVLNICYQLLGGPTGRFTAGLWERAQAVDPRIIVSPDGIIGFVPDDAIAQDPILADFIEKTASIAHGWPIGEDGIYIEPEEMTADQWTEYFGRSGALAAASAAHEILVDKAWREQSTAEKLLLGWLSIVQCGRDGAAWLATRRWLPPGNRFLHVEQMGATSGGLWIRLGYKDEVGAPWPSATVIATDWDAYEGKFRRVIVHDLPKCWDEPHDCSDNDALQAALAALFRQLRNQGDKP